MVVSCSRILLWLPGSAARTTNPMALLAVRVPRWVYLPPWSVAERVAS